MCETEKNKDGSVATDPREANITPTWWVPPLVRYFVYFEPETEKKQTNRIFFQESKRNPNAPGAHMQSDCFRGPCTVQ